MKEQLISFDTAKLAKEKGFDSSTSEYWLKNNTTIFVIDDEYELKCLQVKDQNPDMVYQCKAPTQALLQKWLEENHDIYLQPVYDVNRRYHRVVHLSILKLINKNTEDEKFYWISSFMNTPLNEWKEKGLQEALKLIKK